MQSALCLSRTHHTQASVLMRTISVPVSPTATTREVTARVSRAVAQSHLAINLKGTLKTYPGSVHWHIVKSGEKGTLELTFWPSKRSLWFKISAGRQAAWIDEVLPALAKLLENS